jgi:beta-glucosidase
VNQYQCRPSVECIVSVTNMGKVAGDEVGAALSQVSGCCRRVYSSTPEFPAHPSGAWGTPEVEFRLNARDLSMVTDLGDIIVAEGKYNGLNRRRATGPGVASVDGDFDVKGQIVLPE